MIKHLFIILLASVTFASCTNSTIPKKVEAPVEIPEDFEMIYRVNEFLDDWHKAAADADFDKFFNALSENSIYIGTDKTEVWTKQEFKDFSKPYFDRGIAWDFKSVERNSYFSENKEYFWFDEILSTWMGTTRGSGVIHYNKKQDKFMIVHYVLSMPIPNDTMNDVIEVIKKYEDQQKK